MLPIRSILSLLCAGSVLLAPAAAQHTVIPASALPETTSDALVAALDVGDFTLQSLDVPADASGDGLVSVTLDGTAYTVALYPHSVRAPDFRLLVDVDGVQHEVDAPAPNGVRGVLLEVPGSRVAGTLAGGRLDVTIVTPGDVWGVQPADVLVAGSAADEHVVFRARDTIDRGLTCGVQAVHTDDEAPVPDGYAGLADAKVCDIAIDADFEFFQWNGSSVANTELDIEDIISRVEAIYEVDTDILYAITTIIVRTTSNDPYTSTSPGTRLNQFANEWNSNQGGVVRDVAHLFTGVNIDGSVIGIAQLSVICSIPNAYGLSQSNYTSNKTSRTGLTAHELGHNWSAQHCDGQASCWIMCSGLGGCSGSVTAFGPSSKNSIIAKRNAVNCLDDAVPPPPPVITSVSPASVPALGGGTITIDGLLNFTKTTSVEVDGVVIPKGAGGWNAISDTRITLPAPKPTSLGTKTVQVFNAGGASNASNLTFTETAPPLFTASPIVFPASSDPSVSSLYYDWGTHVGDTTYLVLSIDGTTLPYKGYPFLVNAFLIVAVPLDAAGLASVVLPIPVSAGGGNTLRAQVAFFSGGLDTISPVLVTLIL